MRLGALALGTLLVGACGGKQQTPQPTPTLDDGAGSAAPIDAATAEGSAATTIEAPKCQLEEAGVANVDCGLQFLDAFAKTMCACTTEACVTAVGHDLEHWSAELPASVQAAPGTPEQNVKGEALSTQMRACAAKVVGDHGDGTTGSD